MIINMQLFAIVVSACACAAACAAVMMFGLMCGAITGVDDIVPCRPACICHVFKFPANASHSNRTIVNNNYHPVVILGAYPCLLAGLIGQYHVFIVYVSHS